MAGMIAKGWLTMRASSEAREGVIVCDSLGRMYSSRCEFCVRIYLDRPSGA